MQKPSPLKFNLISNFKFQSILIKTLSLLFVLIAITGAGIYAIFSNTVTQQHKEASRSSQQLMLSGIGASLDTMLSQTGENMNQLFLNQNITGIMMSPGRYDYDRLVSVMDGVSGLAAGDDLVRQSYLYVFGNDMVYCSDGTINSILDSPDKPAIISCLTSSSYSMHSMKLGGAETGLLEADNRIFLFRKYPAYRSLGLLVLELHPELLYKRALDAPGNTNSYMVYVYDRNRKPVFPGQIPYPGPIAGLQSRPAFWSDEQKEITIYSYTSPITGLVAMTLTDNKDLLPSISSVLRKAAPYLIVIILFIVLVSLYLIWIIYSPIQDVIYSMVSSGNNRDTNIRGSELDFISAAYKDSADKNVMLSGVLSEVAPAVTERVIQSLISDAAMEEEAARAMLESIESPFLMGARYLVVLARLGMPEEMDGNNLEAEINQAWFSSLCYNYWEGRVGCAGCHFLRLPDHACVGVLSFRDDASNAHIKFALSGFREIVAKRTEGFRCAWDMGTGQLHVGIMEIRKSYLEAREDLNRQLYFANETAAPDQNREHDLELSVAYYTGRIRQLIGFALDGRMDDAFAGLSMLSEISARQSDPAAVHTVYQSIRNVLIEEMVKYHIDVAEQPGSMPPPDDGRYAAVMEAEISAFCQSGFAMLTAAGQRGRNKHVESAKKYIADNYTNAGLSLDDVSQHVGLSSPYLSRIFAETVGSGFLDYLNQYRIEKAKQLLAATDLHVSEVGFQVGFHSSQNFTRVFKKLLGDTPRQYRDSMKNTP